MNKDTTAALREFAEGIYPDARDHLEKSIYNIKERNLREKFISDLTALINEHYVAKEDAGYPKKFILYAIWDCPFDVEKTDGTTRWIDRDLDDGSYTLDELFNYWKENVR